MAKNLELKIKLENRNEMINKCKNAGAKFIKELNQKDIYYKISNGMLKLRIQNGSNELIKYERDEVNTERWSEYYVLKIDDANAEFFLSKLFSVEVVVEKTRLLYQYKNTRIHLDEVKSLGEFLELESVLQSEELEAKQEFLEVVELLNLDLDKQIKKSYRDLIKNDFK